LVNHFSAGVIGLGSYVPERILTNHDLEKIVDTTDEWIQTRTGITERHISSGEQASSDLGLIAAQRALDDANITPAEIDLIIVATATPDMLFPSTACIIQSKLGANRAAAFDIGAGCTGFIYALVTAAQFISNGSYKKVLVIGAETLSKVTNWSDRNTCVLLADGAGAVVLDAVPFGEGVLGFTLGADGNGGKYLLQPAGGSRLPASIETVKQNLHTLQMNGPEIFKFAVKIMVEVTEETLKKANLLKEDVNLFIPHQANRRIIEAATKRLGFSMNKVVVNIDRFGNTSSASIPIAMQEAFGNGRIYTGDNLLLMGFGAGITWGAVALKWTKQRPET